MVGYGTIALAIFAGLTWWLTRRQPNEPWCTWIVFANYRQVTDAVRRRHEGRPYRRARSADIGMPPGLGSGSTGGGFGAELIGNTG
jgi:hypothetical protein